MSATHHFRKVVLVWSGVVTHNEVSRAWPHRVLGCMGLLRWVTFLRLVIGWARGQEGDVDGEVGPHRVVRGPIRTVTGVAWVDEDGGTWSWSLICTIRR